MQSTTTARVALHRHAVLVHMTPLGARLRSTLKGLGYPPRDVSAVVEFVGVNGTAEGSPADADDVQILNDLVVEHTADVEYEDASQWPAVYGPAVDAPLPPRGTVAEPIVDRQQSPDPWASSDPLPASAAPSWAAPFRSDFEPSYAERLYVASEGRVNLFDEPASSARIDRSLDRLERAAAALKLVLMPISGGSPADSKPVRLRDWDDKTGVRSRPQSDIRDEDVLLHTGSVG